MDTIRYLLSKVFLVILVLVVIMGLYVVFQKYIPGFHISLGNSFFTDNLLPDPVNVQLLGQGSTADLSGNIYQGARSSDVSYVEYTGTGMRIVPATHTTEPMGGQSAQPTQPVGIYVRNLSIYRGGSIYTRITFTGEAQNSFFKNNTFPIYITDMSGNVIAQEQATGLSGWAFPGWTRFTVTVQSVLPVRLPCQMVFRGQAGSSAATARAQEIFPITCN